MDHADVMREVLQPVGDVVLAVVGLEIREPPFELTLPVLQLAEDRFGDPSLLGHDADRLPKHLLSAPHLVEPVPHIDGLALAMRQRGPSLGLGERLLDGCNGFLGVAVDEMLDSGIELGLRFVRGQGFLSKALEAIAQQLVLARETEGLPYGGPDQRQGGEQDGAERKPLRTR
ncbi:hypothetical protein [Bradyrhizobium sp.]|uniref:hypothetical protein n=1 Tax=Bradyrhizobium sp. TaxID=376 RepID=UPI0027375EEC|nr:hypothetical protein [Bradyrhizobium sp.]MDP3692351.1 hypothetical protein [Bradyrhizobium sp.]